MVDTNDEWIKTRTGIHERRILKGEGKGTSDMIVPTVNNLLNNCQVRPEEIDLVIVATITPDRMLPATAMHVAKRCGLVNAFGFDINAACSGFLGGLGLQAHEVMKRVAVGVAGNFLEPEAFTLFERTFDVANSYQFFFGCCN